MFEPLVPFLGSLRAFLAARRGAVTIEFAVGSVVLLTVASAAFDLYSRVSADTTTARMAVIMAEYVSLDPAPSIDQIEELGEFLNEHELGAPADVVYVLTALHKTAGNPVAVLWSDKDSFQFGDNSADVADDCPQFVDDSTPPAPVLPAHFTMADDEIIIIVEVCARLTREGSISGLFVDGDIYHHHALPSRTQGTIPVAPA